MEGGREGGRDGRADGRMAVTAVTIGPARSVQLRVRGHTTRWSAVFLFARHGTVSRIAITWHRSMSR